MRDATLTRRHFELIAATINSLPLVLDSEERMRRSIAYHFAAVLKGSNKAFSTEAFINAALKSDMRRNEKLTKRGENQGLETVVSPITGANGS